MEVDKIVFEIVSKLGELHSNGICNVNTLPCPNLLFSVSEPFKASAIFLAIVSPKPVPPKIFSIPSLAWVNSSKTKF